MAACLTPWRISISETMMTTSPRIFSSKTRAAQEGPHIQLLANVLQAFPSGVGALTWGERLSVLDAWVQVLDGVYAHLPRKRALYGPLPADTGEVETAKFVSGSRLSHNSLRHSDRDIAPLLQRVGARTRGPSVVLVHPRGQAGRHVPFRNGLAVPVGPGISVVDQRRGGVGMPDGRR